MGATVGSSVRTLPALLELDRGSGTAERADLGDRQQLLKRFERVRAPRTEGDESLASLDQRHRQR